MRYKVLTAPFPDDIHGALKKLDGDRYLIVINESMTKEEQDATVRHEYYHMTHNHFDDPRPIAEIEAEAEAGADTIPTPDYKIGEWHNVLCVL